MTHPLPDPARIRPIEVLKLDSYSEGPVVDRQGNLYISHGTAVSKLTPEGRLTQWTTSQTPNWHKVLSNEEHLVCDSKQGAALRISPRGNL